jgi:hypothetical protein
MRPLERSYVEAVLRRDLDEKKAFKHIYEDFAKCNREITQMKNKNNELQAILASKADYRASGTLNGPDIE